MRCHLLFPLTGKRRSCHVEVNARTGKGESGYWLCDGSPLDDDELALVDEIYADEMEQLALEYAAEERWERDTDK